MYIMEVNYLHSWEFENTHDSSLCHGFNKDICAACDKEWNGS